MPKKITGTGSMSLEEALNSPNGYTSNSIESAYLDPAMSQEVADILTENLPDNGFYFLGQAGVCAKEAWEWGNECQRYINDRNEKIRACKALKESKGGEGLDYWNILSTEGVGDFAKKVWEAIKNAIKKLILMVINLIKSIGNFIKGAMAKAQELFWKKYSREILSRAGDSSGEVKIKSVGASQSNICVVNPITLLRACSAGSIAASGALNAVINIVPTELGQGLRDMEAFKKRFLDGIEKAEANQFGPMTQAAKDAKHFYDQIVSTSNKAFPSASGIINKCIYGTEKPSKFEYNCATLVNQYKDVLAGATLTIMAHAMKAGTAANKSLSNGLKVIENIEKKAASDYQNKEDRKEAKSNVGDRLTPLIRQYQRACQFNTTLLLHMYGVALSFRMKIFSAARKVVKKGNSYNGQKVNNDTDLQASSPNRPVGRA